jgi:hypothetical protein
MLNLEILAFFDTIFDRKKCLDLCARADRQLQGLQQEIHDMNAKQLSKLNSTFNVPPPIPDINSLFFVLCFLVFVFLIFFVFAFRSGCSISRRL